MQVPASDLDFYERKIYRLQSDIQTLHQELNMARMRLRTAEDYQIKYQLLLRQSNQQNIRLKSIEEAERARFTKILQQQIENYEKQSKDKFADRQKQIQRKYAEQNELLQRNIEQLKEKNAQLAEKAEQTDVLLFKNKKIAKDLQYLEELISENKQQSQRQRQNQLKACKDAITKKFTEKLSKQKQMYENKIEQLQSEYEKISIKVKELELDSARDDRNTLEKSGTVLTYSKLTEELQKYKKLLDIKDDQIDKLLTERISNQKLFMEEIKSLKDYADSLETKIFELQENQNTELINLKNRMNQIKQKELFNMKANLKQKGQLWTRQKVVLECELQDIKSDLRVCRQKAERDLEKANERNQRASNKLSQLQDRLRIYQHKKELGQTDNLIASLRQFDSKEDEVNNYQNGITFLERQLKRAAIKIQKKNFEVKELVNQLNNVRSECQQQIVELKEKYYQQSKEMQAKITSLEDEIIQLNNQIRARDQQRKEKQGQLITMIAQSNAQSRSLRQLNNDLQRDYNRVLESKRHIQKSFREQRERSVTSKSQIAIGKKQKWLDLERQKNDIQIIYKEREQQIKLKNQSELENLRYQKSKLQQQKELYKQQLEDLKKRKSEGGPDLDNKENIHSEYSKKLAAINLQIALTENIYKTLVEARSKTKISHIGESIISQKSQRQESQASFQQAFKIQSPKSFKEQDFLKEEDCGTPYFPPSMLVSFKPGNPPS